MHLFFNFIVLISIVDVPFLDFTISVGSPLLRLGPALRRAQILRQRELQRRHVRGGTTHVEALRGEVRCLLAARAVDPALLAGLVGGAEDAGDGVGELGLHDAVDDGVADVVT